MYDNGSLQDTIYCKDVEEREDAGTPGIVQKIRAALAFRVKDYIGQAFIHDRETLLMQRALGRLLRNLNVYLLGNMTTNCQPIISFLVYPDIGSGKHLHCRFVTKLLNDLFGIQARGGCACAGPYGHMLLNIDKTRALAIRSVQGYEGLKPGWTRISFSYYTPVEEMEFVVDAIEFIAKCGHRFLPLYDFDWRTGDWHFISTNTTDALSAETYLDGKEHDTNSQDNSMKYKDYMDTAKQIANTLSDCPEERALPDYIDPQLVKFRI